MVSVVPTCVLFKYKLCCVPSITKVQCLIELLAVIVSAVGAVGLPIPANDPLAPVIFPVAVIVVDDELPLPLIDPLVVEMFPLNVDMFPFELIVPFVVDMFPYAVIAPVVDDMCPVAAIVPLVAVLPFDNTVNC